MFKSENFLLTFRKNLQRISPPLGDCVAMGEIVKNVMLNLVLNLIQYCFSI
jgi:hypothetical protein